MNGRALAYVSRPVPLSPVSHLGAPGVALPSPPPTNSWPRPWGRSWRVSVPDMANVQPPLVTRDIRYPRQAGCARTIAFEKQYTHRRARRANRQYDRALAMQVDPDAPNHPLAEARLARGNDPQCTATVLEYAGRGRPWQPTRCAYVQGHAASHFDGCVAWENADLPLSQRDEPRERLPRALTGWDLW